MCANRIESGPFGKMISHKIKPLPSTVSYLLIGKPFVCMFNGLLACDVKLFTTLVFLTAMFVLFTQILWSTAVVSRVLQTASIGLY